MKREELINAFVLQWGQDGMYDKTLKADVYKLINLIIATQPQQSDKEMYDILDCISQFDDTETLENKGRYFEVIQKDIRKYLCPPE